VISERTPQFRSTAVISAWVIFVAASCVVLVGQIPDFDLFQQKESFQGPFDKESSETSQSYVIPLARNSHLGTLFTTSGDTPDHPRRSNLSLRINGRPAGPAHTIHEEIRKHGGGRYSHWGDVLLFSLPTDTTNGPSTTATVEYSPRIQRRIYRFGCVALALSATFLLIRACRVDPGGLRRKREFFARSAGALCLAFYGVAATATAIYLVTVAIGLLQGSSLPNTAVFNLFPWTRELAMYEPGAHYLIAFMAMLGAVLSWLAPSFQKDEGTLIRHWNRYGLLATAALFLFSLGAMWSGIARREDMQSNAMAGLVPLSDARGYFEITFDQVITGYWTPLAEQRPFAAAHRSVLMFLAGYSNVRFLLLQALAIACVTYVATRAVMLWRGLWSGLMFFALTLALVRPYLTTHLTEPLGQFWALLAVPFVIRLLRHGGLIDGAASFLTMTISLLTRMGSMFTIPAFAIWFAWNQARDPKRLKVTLLTITTVLLGCSLVSAALLRLYGSGTGFLGSNFSFVICGATHGGDWRTCKSLYDEELRTVGPGFGASQAHYLYTKAWEGFRRDPSVLFNRLIQGEQMFLENLIPVMLGGYTTPFTPRWFPRTAWTVIAVYGLGITLWRRREQGELSFWLFMWLGLLTSAPLIIFADGWRVLSNVLPFVAVFLACGFATAAHVRASVAPAESKASNLALAGVLITTSLWIVVPGLAHWLDPLGARPFKTLPSKPGEPLVLGSQYMAGFIVVPDNQPVPSDVPSIRRSQFTKALEYSAHDAYRKLTFPPPSSAFAFVAAPNANGTLGIRYVFVAPVEVLTRRDVPAWQLTLQEEVEEADNVRWARVTAATPIGPARR
jgi:hypothetical protein